MAKKHNSAAARGGFGFTVAALCVVGFAGACGYLAVNDSLTVGRVCLYGIAFGTVGGVAWPDQDSGDAFINQLGDREDEN